MKNLKRAFILVLLFTMLIGAVSCSGSKMFKVESIETQNSGFSGISGSSLSSSNIILVGKVGAKKVEIQLNNAFENCKIEYLSGQYDNAFAFNPSIASLNVDIADENGKTHSLTISAGDTFSAVKSGDKVTLLLP